MPSDPVQTLEALGGWARTRDLLAAGVDPRVLHAARDRGEVTSLARGVWALPTANVPDPDLIAVTIQMPGAVFGVLTALVLHDLTDEIPRQIHVLLPHGRHPPRISGIPVVGFHVYPARLDEGITTMMLGDHEIRVTDVARTITDAFKYRRNLGPTVARDALVEALRRRATTPGKVMSAAQSAGVASVVRPVLEALT